MIVANVARKATISHQYVDAVLCVFVANATIQIIAKLASTKIQQTL